MKKIIFTLLLVLIMALTLTVPALAEVVILDDNEQWITGEETVTDPDISDPFEDMEPVEGTPRVVDRVGLLSVEQEAALTLKLDEISQRQQFDVVVVTVYSLGGKSAMAYADDFFDYNGYGFGENHDGILLLVSMERRDWWISTTGYGITAFTDAGLEYISDCVVPKLSKGQYAKAFEVFAEKCDGFISQARTGEPYDVGNMPKEPFRIGLCLLISAFIGMFAAGCVIWTMQRQLQTVNLKTDARDYSRAVTPRLTTNTETYLYSTMSSRPRVKLNLDEYSGSRSYGGFGGASGGGSTTHRSSSGRTHGGRGGKF